MIGRRGFLAALMAAPVAAESAIGQAASSAAVPYPSVEPGMPPQENPIVRAARKHIRKLERREEHLRYATQQLPHKFSGKKSWSPAFKEHCFLAEEAASIHSSEVWDMTEDELVSFAIKRGWSGLS